MHLQSYSLDQLVPTGQWRADVSDHPSVKSTSDHQTGLKSWFPLRWHVLSPSSISFITTTAYVIGFDRLMNEPENRG